MAIHTEYSVRMNSAYPPTTRRSPSLPASARKAPRPRRLATVDHLIPVILVTRCPREAGATPASARGHCKVSYWAHRITVRHRWGSSKPAQQAGQPARRPFPRGTGVIVAGRRWLCTRPAPPRPLTCSLAFQDCHCCPCACRHLLLTLGGRTARSQDRRHAGIVHDARWTGESGRVSRRGHAPRFLQMKGAAVRKPGFTLAWVCLGVLAASTLVAAMLAPPAAGATSAGACLPSGKCFAVTVSPTSPAAGSSAAFAFAITNEAPTQQLGSVQISAPNGFVITGASGSGTFTSSSALFLNLSLAPSATITLTVSAVAPCG